MIRRLLLALLLFSSPVLAEEDRIYYVHKRPLSSYSGIIGDDGYFYKFTNSAISAYKDGCDMRIDGPCFIKTDVSAKIVKERNNKNSKYVLVFRSSNSGSQEGSNTISKKL